MRALSLTPDDCRRLRVRSNLIVCERVHLLSKHRRGMECHRRLRAE
jgi:hypothetical protein